MPNKRNTHDSNPALTRRKFLHRSGGVAATMAVLTAAQQPAAVAQAVKTPANKTAVVLGLIGCGRRGRQLIEAASRVQGITLSMVCDVDAERSAAAAEQVMKLFGVRPAVTSDYRDLLDSPDIKGVIIATPDHWHSSQLLSACAAEKDVYVEAPLSLHMNESNAMIYAARKYKRVVQVGMQLRSSSKFAEAGTIVRSGNLGRIAQTRTWAFARTPAIANQPDAPPPASLDYDRWLGPAPERPYNPVRRDYPEHFWDYGGGEASLYNVHLQDLVHAAMRVTVPSSVVAVGGKLGLNDFRETPDTLEAVYEYETPSGPFVQTFSLRLSNAYAGWGPSALPAADSSAGNFPARHGVQFFGTEKTLFVNDRRLLLLPSGDESPIEDLAFLGIGLNNATSRPAEEAQARTVAHLREFVDCMESRKEPSASIEAAQRAIFPCIAANVAYRLGRKLYVNIKTLEFFTDPGLKTLDAEANGMTVRPYRESYPPPNV